jgi:hypothetical protein
MERDDSIHDDLQRLMQRLNTELDLQSLFGLMCTAVPQSYELTRGPPEFVQHFCL